MDIPNLGRVDRWQSDQLIIVSSLRLAVHAISAWAGRWVSNNSLLPNLGFKEINGLVYTCFITRTRIYDFEANSRPLRTQLVSKRVGSQKTNPRRKALESPDGNSYWYKAGPHDANLDTNMHIHINKTWNKRNCTRKHIPLLREKCIQQRRCNAGGNKENKIRTWCCNGPWQCANSKSIISGTISNTPIIYHVPTTLHTSVDELPLILNPAEYRASIWIFHNSSSASQSEFGRREDCGSHGLPSMSRSNKTGSG